MYCDYCGQFNLSYSNELLTWDIEPNFHRHSCCACHETARVEALNYLLNST